MRVNYKLHILVPRGWAPFGQHQELQPLRRSTLEASNSRTDSGHAQSQV